MSVKTREILTAAGWVARPVNHLNRVEPDEEDLCECCKHQQASQIVFAGRTQHGRPILWAQCLKCSQESSVSFAADRAEANRA